MTYCRWDSAYVSGTVMSHAKGLPLAHGRSVTPSGRLPSCRIRLTGSLAAGICALFIIITDTDTGTASVLTASIARGVCGHHADAEESRHEQTPRRDDDSHDAAAPHSASAAQQVNESTTGRPGHTPGNHNRLCVCSGQAAIGTWEQRTGGRRRSWGPIYKISYDLS